MEVRVSKRATARSVGDGSYALQVSGAELVTISLALGLATDDSIMDGYRRRFVNTGIYAAHFKLHLNSLSLYLRLIGEANDMISIFGEVYDK